LLILFPFASVGIVLELFVCSTISTILVTGGYLSLFAYARFSTVTCWKNGPQSIESSCRLPLWLDEGRVIGQNGPQSIESSCLKKGNSGIIYFFNLTIIKTGLSVSFSLFASFSSSFFFSGYSGAEFLNSSVER
jgi:hypothetical protein